MFKLLRLFLLLSPLLVPVLATAAAPTRAAHRRALEADAPARVTVHGARGSGRGTLVGAGGQVLTVVDFVSLDSAKVQRGESACEASVLSADATSRLAIIACEPGTLAPQTPVAASPQEMRDTGWAIAVLQKKGEAGARSVRLLEQKDGSFLVATSLPAGTPLYDDRGRLLGLTTRREAHRSRALSISALRAHVRGVQGAAGRTSPAR